VLFASTAKLPPPLRRFAPAPLTSGITQASLHILFPPDGARLDLSSTDGKPDPVPLKITGAVAPLTVFVNGNPVSPQDRGTLFFKPDGPGFSRVTVVDATGATDSVVVRVDDEASARVSPPRLRALISAAPANARGNTAAVQQ
jgi:penicillin-binding protein 1C